MNKIVQRYSIREKNEAQTLLNACPLTSLNCNQYHSGKHEEVHLVQEDL